jgi:hypothetical protein
LNFHGLRQRPDDKLVVMLGHQQTTKTVARVLFAVFCFGWLCGLGVLIYVIILMEQFRGALRQTVVAMNNPEKLAIIERAIQEERLVSSLVLAIILIVAAIPLAMGVKHIRAALRTN